MGLTKEEKLEIIDNIKKKGDDGDVDYGEVIRSVEKMADNFITPSSSDQFNVPDDFFSRYWGISPLQFIDMVKTNSSNIREELGGSVNYNLDAFINSLNKSNLYPYTAAKKEGEDMEWGFYRGVDRYEKTFDNQGNPIYMRFYKDGSYDTLEEDAFNDEKYFNYLPKNMKDKYMIPIDESSMDESERSNMYESIKNHQANMLRQMR